MARHSNGKGLPDFAQMTWDELRAWRAAYQEAEPAEYEAGAWCQPWTTQILTHPAELHDWWESQPEERRMVLQPLTTTPGTPQSRASTL